ncbi:unnamed protein product, partial [Symbiodinium sp. CCMP2456]
ALPMLGVALGICADVSRLFQTKTKWSAEVRWILGAAGLLLLPGVLSFVNAVLAALPFLEGFASWRPGRRREALEHLQEVRAWHLVMLITLLACMACLRRAQHCKFRQAQGYTS